MLLLLLLLDLVGVQSQLPDLRASAAELAASNEALRKGVAELQAARDAVAAKLDKEKAALAARGASCSVLSCSLAMIRPREGALTRALPAAAAAVLSCDRHSLACVPSPLPVLSLSLFAEGELARTEASLAALTTRVEAQELTAADVERMAAKREALRQQYAALRDAAAGVDAETADAVARLKKALASLNTRIGEYTALASKLQLLPLGAKYSFGVDFAVRVNTGFLDALGSGSTGSGDTMDMTASAAAGGGVLPTASAATTASLLGADLKGVIKPQLR